jgi:hypothetical protein
MRYEERRCSVRELVQDIHLILRGIEQHAALWHESSFAARVHALDVLRSRALERIENVLYVHGYNQQLASLYYRAEQLWERVHAVNTALFRRLREQLSTERSHYVAGSKTLKGPCEATVLPAKLAGQLLCAALSTHPPAATFSRLCDRYVGQAEAAPAREGSDEDYLDVFVNGVLGIDAAPEETFSLESGMIGYVPTPARVIFALLDHLSLRADDVFYDVGSGLGRVALLVGLLTAAQATGIEVEPAYCAVAQQSAQRLHLERVTFINGDARQANYADGTVFFLYTPCTGRMFQEVLDRLHEEARVRPIRLAAYGLCTAQVVQQTWLHLTMRQAFAHDTLAVFRSR